MSVRRRSLPQEDSPAEQIALTDLTLSYSDIPKEEFFDLLWRVLQLGGSLHVSWEEDTEAVGIYITGGQRKMSTSKMLELTTTEEYQAFTKDLSAYSYEEKVELAQKDGAKWDRHENPRIDVLRLTDALAMMRGVPKWRKEYTSPQNRDKLLYGKA